LDERWINKKLEGYWKDVKRIEWDLQFKGSSVFYGEYGRHMNLLLTREKEKAMRKIKQLNFFLSVEFRARELFKIEYPYGYCEGWNWVTCQKMKANGQTDTLDCPYVKLDYPCFKKEKADILKNIDYSILPGNCLSCDYSHGLPKDGAWKCRAWGNRVVAYTATNKPPFVENPCSCWKEKGVKE
jgi:hypothetical protein